MHPSAHPPPDPSSSADPLARALADLLRPVPGDGAGQAGGALPGGGRWTRLADACWRLDPAPGRARPDAPALLLSAGIHGDETGPAELLDALLRALATGSAPLRVPVLALFGNPAALRAHRRFLHTDLNRLFSGRHAGRDGPEAARAAGLEALATAFLDEMEARDTVDGPRVLQLDLHTAIRASEFERFALLPVRADGHRCPVLMRWLRAAGMQAVVLNRTGAGTFSAVGGTRARTRAATLELGRVGAFGRNDLSRFDAAARALRALAAGEPPSGATEAVPPPVFRVVQDILRTGPAFRLRLDARTANFSPLPEGMTLAEDGDRAWTVDAPDARILFPNPDVAIGLRAGLVLRPADDGGRD